MFIYCILDCGTGKYRQMNGSIIECKDCAYPCLECTTETECTVCDGSSTNRET